MSLNILLVDDHEVVRVGLRTLIERQPGMQVVGDAGTAAQAISLARQLAPDVIVLDIRLPDDSGLEVCRRIKAERPETRIIVLTSSPDDKTIFDAIAAGADGYVLKLIGSDALIQALEQVGRGESPLDPSITNRVLAKVREATKHEQAQAFACLTAQEMRILSLVAEGQTNREIGAALHLSEKTARNYISDILGKLGLTSRAQAAAYAARHRIEDYL